MECHANEGYNPVDEDLEQTGYCSTENIQGVSAENDVHVSFDVTNEAFCGEEDESTSSLEVNPVENTTLDESGSPAVPNPVENAVSNAPLPSEVDSIVTPLSSLSSSVASTSTESGRAPSEEIPLSVSPPTATPLPDGVTASSQLIAHHSISPIILSPSLPPVAPFSILARKTSKDANVPLNSPSNKDHRETSKFASSFNSERDHVIQIFKESDVDSRATFAKTTTVAKGEEAVKGEPEAVSSAKLPEPERIGGRCRDGSTSNDGFRLMSKSGQRHVYSRVSPTTRYLKYTRDIFTTMVDLEWKYHLVIWMASFCLSWIGFGILWWLTVTPNYGNDDYYYPSASNASHLTNSSSYPVLSSSSSSPSPPSCLENVQDITGAILFSIETQSTIGYGLRYIRSDCHPLAYILFFVQVLSGVCIAFFLSGVIFRKLSRPYGRASTILFSRCAVIRLNDAGSDYCLEFRMGDIRKSHVIGTSIRALMVKDRLTSEGERIPLCQYPLQLDTQSSVTDSFVFMPWPIIVSHKIDADSPLWTVSRWNMREERFEIIVMFEGVVESTGASTQFRTSYIPSEVIWGHRFASLPILEKVSCNGHTRTYVDFGDFDKTIPVEMDDRNAKDFAEDRKRLVQDFAPVIRNTGTMEHRMNGTLERRESGTPEQGYAEAIRYSNTESTEVVVADTDHPFQKVPVSPEELALRLHRRFQKKVKRGQSAKPQPTKSALLTTPCGEGIAANGQEPNKSYTF